MGKQVGPLPVGAWVVVVAGGLGIALYTRRQNAATPTEIGVDTSGDAGVGTGAVGGFIPTSPQPGPTGTMTPTTNEDWAVNAERVLIAKNYPPTTVDSMVRKYIAGVTSSLSPAEWSLLAIALADPAIGPVPQPIPPDGNPPVVTPPSGTPVPTPSTGVRNTYQARAGQSMYDVEKIAHPNMNAAQANNAALISIHYNIAHGIKPWPRTMPGPVATQYRFKRAVRVYVT